MPYSGLAIPLYNVVSPHAVLLGGSATNSGGYAGFTSLTAAEDSSAVFNFRLPKTVLADSAAVIEISVFKADSGTEAPLLEGAYFIANVGSTVDVASLTSLAAFTESDATGTDDTTLGKYTITIPAGSGLAEDSLIVVLVQRTGSDTEGDTFAGEVILADCSLKIITDDMGQPV